MILLDLFIVAYIAFSVWRGRKQGIIAEAPGTVSLAVFFFSGWGLLKALYKGLASTSEMVGHSVGLVTFVGLVVLAVVIWKRIQRRIRWRAEQLCPESKRAAAGAVAGGIKAFLLAAIVLLICAHGPLKAVTRWIPEGTLIGRGLIKFVLPVYDKTHSTL